MKQIVTISLFPLLIIGGCSKEAIPGFVGKAYTVSVDIPEDSKDMDFVWDVVEKPQESALKYNDFDFTEDFAHMTFVPDAEGAYLFEVKIFQYNDEIASQSYSFDVVDDGFRPEQDMLPTAVKDEDPPRSEPISETVSAEDLEPEPGPAAAEEEPEVQVVETIVKAKPKPKAKKTKKPVLGQKIPFDAGRFTIQVASKKNLDDAKRVAAGLIKDGFDAYIQKAYFEETDAVWFRVRVGSYNDREQAIKVAAAVSEIMTEPAWVDFVRYEE